jgi:hypothetical protein
MIAIERKGGRDVVAVPAATVRAAVAVRAAAAVRAAVAVRAAAAVRAAGSAIVGAVVSIRVGVGVVIVRVGANVMVERRIVKGGTEMVVMSNFVLHLSPVQTLNCK